MITLNSICKIYTTKQGKKITALDKVSLVLPDTGLICIVGESGSGKSTLLNIVGGLDNFDSGEMIIQGVSTSNFKEKEWNAYRGSYVGFIFQDNNTISDLSISENVILGVAVQKNFSKKNIKEILSKAGLDDFENQKVYELSGGEEQKVVIARILAKDSRIILADEPTGSLDLENTISLFDTLKNLSKTKLVVVVTHDQKNAQKYSDQIVELKDGHISSNYLSSNNDSSSEEFQITKSHFPLKQKLALGISILKIRPLIFLITIFISVLSFSIFSYYLNATSLDYNKDPVNVVNQFGTLMIGKNFNINDVKNGTVSPYFSLSDYNSFREEYPNSMVFPVYESSTHTQLEYLTSSQESYYSNSFNGLTHLSEGDLNSLNYSLIAGEYPNELWSDNDIAISFYMFEFFRNRILPINEILTPINTPNDLLGYKIRTLTIRGIIDTNYDQERYLPFKKLAETGVLPPEVSTKLWKEHRIFRSFGPQLFIYTKPLSPSSLSSEEKMLYFFGSISPTVSDNTRIPVMLKNDKYYRIGDPFTDQLYSFYLSNLEGARVLTLLSLVFLAIASLLITFFVTGRISEKMLDIGILRSTGASKKDIIDIYFIQSILIAFIIFILSTVLTGLVLIPHVYFLKIEPTLPFKIYSFTFWDIIILFAVIFISVGISTLIPFLKIIKKTPRDLMNI
jgi:ABC-type lipoprotein export system ATPase subunit